MASNYTFNYGSSQYDPMGYMIGVFDASTSGINHKKKASKNRFGKSK